MGFYLPNCELNITPEFPQIFHYSNEKHTNTQELVNKDRQDFVSVGDAGCLGGSEEQ